MASTAVGEQGMKTNICPKQPATAFMRPVKICAGISEKAIIKADIEGINELRLS